MRYRRIVIFIVCCVSCIFVALSLMAQERKGIKVWEPPASQVWTEEDALRILEKGTHMEQVASLEQGDVITYIYQDLITASEVAVRLESESIVHAIVDFPVHDPGVGEAKVIALKPFKDNLAAYGCVIEMVEDPEPMIHRAAARVLFGWEEWDLSIPIIHKYGNYDALGVSKNN
ncbi:hypothetical protein KKG05_01755, partial [bacterium]|nr:hypothetical protein [bacterium]